jgi:hypothetical protein
VNCGARKHQGRGRPRLNLPVVTFKLDRCPICKSVEIPVKRTLLREAEFVRQERQCEKCGHRFEAIAD